MAPINSPTGCAGATRGGLWPPRLYRGGLGPPTW